MGRERVERWVRCPRERGMTPVGILGVTERDRAEQVETDIGKQAACVGFVPANVWSNHNSRL